MGYMQLEFTIPEHTEASIFSVSGQRTLNLAGAGKEVATKDRGGVCVPPAEAGCGSDNETAANLWRRTIAKSPTISLSAPASKTGDAASKKGVKAGGGGDAEGTGGGGKVRSGRHCSPRHRMPRDSRTEDLQCVEGCVLAQFLC